ncbi:hypothetical protein LNKW23_17550 [Paralimibaculum aggregatum]|uniref:Peptidyl-Asp metalloendopeptidase n=1 Tax=Paralimibaculum aggregatum TaxID=3036245 RepID=A0ABQ6LHS8_9RHOB|nr:M12 family metallo-peptidase [Limibaculum sp. NKW23]GMG82542.1 hypothetical protein LNKW23_17550 [Limibaculum sp. NKW23]
MRRVLTAAAVASFLAGSAAAQSPSLIEYFADGAQAEAAGDAASAALAALKANPAVSDIALGRIAPAAADGAAGFSIALPAGAGAINFTALDLGPASTAGRVLVAESAADGSRLTAVLGDSGATGTLRTPRGLYKMAPMGDGTTAVYRFETAGLADHPPAGAPVPEAVTRDRAAPDDGAPPETTEAGKTRLDVIVAYTPDAATEVADIDALIALAVKETNDIYDASGIPAEIRLVHSYRTDYNGPEDMALDLRRFREPDDGTMDEVHALRDRHGADLAVLIVSQNKNACGYGYIDAAEDRAFSVVAQHCATGYYSFAHEIGHNLGAFHDIAQGRNARYPYGHGYCNSRNGEEGGWRTVMSYASDNCDDRLPVFSRAEPLNGVRFGDAGTMDNARLHRETVDRASRFRGAPGGSGAPRTGTGTGSVSLTDTPNFGVGEGGEGQPKGAQGIVFE